MKKLLLLLAASTMAAAPCSAQNDSVKTQNPEFRIYESRDRVEYGKPLVKVVIVVSGKKGLLYRINGFAYLTGTTFYSGKTINPGEGSTFFDAKMRPLKPGIEVWFVRKRP